MAYIPPAHNAVNFDLKPTGSATVVIPAHNAVNFDLATEDGSGSGPGPVDASDNARLRNFAILLAI